MVEDVKQLECKDILSIQQLILPYINHDDANRLQMASSHLTQALPLIDAEVASSPSIYNKDMVKYSDMITYAKDDMENLGKVKLQNEEFLLLKSEKELELYKVDTPILSSAFTARHTYVTDKKKIKKNEPIIVTGNATMEGNLKIGVNALTGYMVYGNNFEDSIIVSESFAKRLVHVEKDVIKFVVNANEYLLNIYGDENEYKCLPEIGSEIDPYSRIVCAKRVVDKGFNAFVELSRNSNRTINFFGNDTIYYNKGKIVDISIYSNLEENEEQEKSEFHKSIEPYLNKNREDIKHFLSLVEPYFKEYRNKESEFKFGPNLQFYYNKFRKIDNNNVLTLNDKKFNGLLFKITVERECVAEIGTKLSNTHGGKGVITKILPDHEMPIRKKDGKNLDLIFSPNSVIGRINTGQIFEVLMNRIAEEVYEEMFSKNSAEESMSLYLEFLKDLLPKRLHSQIKPLEKLKDKKLLSFIESIKEDGFLYIPQVPFENITFNNISKWYNRYKLTDDYITIKGHDIINPIATGKQLILKLKHEPSKKISYVNVKKFGTKTLQPAKAGNEFKSSKLPNLASPNTLGEQECSILMALSKDMHVLKELAFLKSSDAHNRELMLEKLYDDKEIYLKDFDKLESIAVKNLNYYLNVIGLAL